MQLIRFFRIQLNSALLLLSNPIWLVSSEFIAKISRIFTIIVPAAQLSPISYGTAILALVFHDVYVLLFRTGVASQYINSLFSLNPIYLISVIKSLKLYLRTLFNRSKPHEC